MLSREFMNIVIGGKNVLVKKFIGGILFLGYIVIFLYILICGSDIVGFWF